MFTPRLLQRLSLLSLLPLSGAGAAPVGYSALASLPDREGFAGMYAAATGQGLVAAGGHHFLNGVPWWDGGSKGWSDAIYVLNTRSGTWQTRDEKLPRPLGDGVAVAHENGMICAGGGDAMQAYRDVFHLRWSGDRIETVMLPSLPTPRLKMGGARLGDIFYLAGGRDHPSSPVALHSFIALDLSRPAGQRKWTSLPAWPGPPRMMPVVAVTADSLFVFGGIDIVPDTQGKPKNVTPYLSDAYCYQPERNAGRWKKIANLPRPVAGAPTPAWWANKNTILIFGGVDGAIEAITDRSSVRGLPDDILAYDIERNSWRVAGRIGAAMVPRVNAPALPWDDGYVIVSGEHLPARRTNAVTFVTKLPSDAMPAK